LTESKKVSDLRIGVVGTPGKWSSELLADAFAERTGYRLLVDLGEVVVDLAQGQARFHEHALHELDALVVKKIDQEYGWSNLDRIEMLRMIESCGVRVFSRPESLIRLIDRLSCTVTLSAAGIPMPATVITEDVDEAVEAVMGFEGAVLKPLYSTKARGMRVLGVEDRAAVEREVRQFQAEGNPVMYIQRRVDIPGRDLGVAFVGGEYLATYARVSAGDSWNTTTRDGGHYEGHEPGEEIIDLARRAQDLFDLDFTAVDVVETAEGPMVFEVSAFGGFRGLQEGPGVDAGARYVDYVIGALTGG
jgi:ribosomal protein S6--L-glutamate ligase